MAIDTRQELGGMTRNERSWLSGKYYTLIKKLELYKSYIGLNYSFWFQSYIFIVIFRLYKCYIWLYRCYTSYTGENGEKNPKLYRLV